MKNQLQQKLLIRRNNCKTLNPGVTPSDLLACHVKHKTCSRCCSRSCYCCTRKWRHDSGAAHLCYLFRDLGSWSTWLCWQKFFAFFFVFGETKSKTNCRVLNFCQRQNASTRHEKKGAVRIAFLSGERFVGCQRNCNRSTALALSPAIMQPVARITDKDGPSALVPSAWCLVTQFPCQRTRSGLY